MIDQVRTLKALLDVLLILATEGISHKGFEADGYLKNGKRFKIEIRTREVTYDDNVVPIERTRRF